MESKRMTENNELLIKINSLIQNQKTAVLATSNNGSPYCSLVAVGTGAEEHILLFATLKDTRKYKNIIKEANVSLLIENTKNTIEDFEKAMALTILGKAQTINDKNLSSAKKYFLKSHPNLKDFVETPDCVLISINIDKYILVSHFQQVIEYEP